MALPTLVDPRKLANQGIVLEGHFEAKHLPRLALAVESIESPLATLIKFEVDQVRAKVVNGAFEIAVMATCQRCLEPVRVNWLLI